MPVTVIERAGSRSWSIAQKGSESSVQCTYLVRWVPSAAEAYPGDATVLGDANLPKPSTRAPAALHNSDAWIKQMICRTVTLTPESSVPYAWTVQATYSTVWDPYENAGRYVRVSKSAADRTLGQYRTFTTIPTNGTVSWPPTDMGGTKLDLHGTPKPLSVATETITLEYVHDRSGSTTTPVEPDWYTFGLRQGTRNSVDMFNGVYKVGTLLYKGCQATLEQECWRLIHVWQFDNLWHLEQVPCPNPTGQPVLAATGTFNGTTGFMQTVLVGWYQRYPTLANSLSMLPSDVQDALVKSYPVLAP